MFSDPCLYLPDEVFSSFPPIRIIYIPLQRTLLESFGSFTLDSGVFLSLLKKRLKICRGERGMLSVLIESQELQLLFDLSEIRGRRELLLMKDLRLRG